MKAAKQGFTLIELLVVIAIIAILAAILFPVFAKARNKAREITSVSNEQQIAMGILQYFQDYDERPVPDRCFGTGWWSGQELIWKDLIDPYIKSGGRPYDNGQTYTTPGNGGVYCSPENTACWSKTQAIYWGFAGPGEPGDETTRYPRSYALNDDAGINELNGKGPFWPEITSTNPGSANLGKVLNTIQNPANTIMICETRMFYANMWGNAFTYECTPSGIPAGGQATGCVEGDGAGFTNFAFFDGHVKSIRMQDAIAQDLWDTYASTLPNSYWGRPAPTQQQDDLQSVNGIEEWNPGF